MLQVMVVILLAAISAMGCRRTSWPSLTDFPSSVGPPFGLDGLPSGANRFLATMLLQRSGTVDVDERSATLRANDYDTVETHFDHLFTSYVVVSQQPCQLGRTLVPRWGPGTQVGSVTTWAASSGEWIGRFADGPRCALTFLSLRSLPTRVSAIGSVARIHPGMTREEAVALAPGIAGAATAVALPELPDSSVGVKYDDQSGLVESTMVLLPPWIAHALEDRWGPGTPSAGVYTMWHDRETKVRACAFMHDDGLVRRIDFDTYVPWQQWIGDGTEVAALSGPVVGATREEMVRRYGRALAPDVDVGDSFEYLLSVPPMELTPPGASKVRIVFDATNRVRATGFSLQYESRETRAAMLSALEAKWGPRTVRATGWEQHQGTRTIQIDELAPGELVITIREQTAP